MLLPLLHVGVLVATLQVVFFVGEKKYETTKTILIRENVIEDKHTTKNNCYHKNYISVMASPNNLTSVACTTANTTWDQQELATSTLKSAIINNYRTVSSNMLFWIVFASIISVSVLLKNKIGFEGIPPPYNATSETNRTTSDDLQKYCLERQAAFYAEKSKIDVCMLSNR